ncbi:hypothetical protein RAS1_25690 [Phycisphaerae bacterium RAS1]|nr:hypothetical protein RAS1_25690 [Phycisphaerae bacterium RAS1]
MGLIWIAATLWMRASWMRKSLMRWRAGRLLRELNV